MAVSDKICLNDYREMYEENESKAITEVTRVIELMMQEQITHVSDINDTDFHEQIMMVTRKGMNVKNYKPSLSLKERWLYSRNLAKWLNKQLEEPKAPMEDLRKELNNYFNLLENSNIEEHMLHWKINHPDGSRMKEVFLIILLFPFALLGLFHLIVPYLITKKYVENTFKRKVFWGSTKVIAGGILAALFNGVFIYLFHALIYPSWWLAVLYFFSIGVFGLIAYNWYNHLKQLKIKGVINSTDLSTLIEHRKDLEEKVNKLVPNHFD